MINLHPLNTFSPWRDSTLNEIKTTLYFFGGWSINSLELNTLNEIFSDLFKIDVKYVKP